MKNRHDEKKETGDITCACPKCGYVIQWAGTASGSMTVCPDCLSHYYIKIRTGVFIEEPSLIDPKTRKPLEAE